MAWISFFAETHMGPIGRVALEYMRGLIRIAPVRLVTMTGTLDGPSWGMFERCMVTPMDGGGTPMVNVVCTDPSHWITRFKVGMPKTDPLAAVLAGKAPSAATESVDGVRECVWAGTRNVLIVLKMPSSKDQAATAEKYQELLTDSRRIQNEWPGGGRLPAVVPVPITDHAAFRNLVLGPPKET